MEVWPNWAARWTQLQPSPSIKEGSAPYFISCTTIDRWPCLGDKRTKQRKYRENQCPISVLLLNTQFKSAALFFSPSLYYANKLALGKPSRWAVWNPELGAACVWTLSCQKWRWWGILKVIGGGPGGGGVSHRLDSSSTCEPVGADAFRQGHQ